MSECERPTWRQILLKFENFLSPGSMTILYLLYLSQLACGLLSKPIGLCVFFKKSFKKFNTKYTALLLLPTAIFNIVSN